MPGFYWWREPVFSFASQRQNRTGSQHMTKPDLETCVEQVARPLEKHPDLHAGATAEIRQRLAASGASADWLRQAVAGFERVHRRGLLRHWKILLYACVLASVVVGMFNARHMKNAIAFMGSMSSISYDFLSTEPTTHFTQDEILLLYGRKDAPSQAERWEALWQTDPTNPAYFAEYVRGVFDDTKSVPDEILRQAETIDPGNGWYHALKAAALLSDIVERKRQSDEDRDALRAPEYTVKDEARLNEAIALLHEAIAMPHFNSHHQELIRRRLIVLGQPEDWISYIPVLAYVAGMALPDGIAMREFTSALAVAAERCAEQGDREGFLRLVATWESLTRNVLNNGFTFVEILVGKVMFAGPVVTFRDAARRLGLEDQAARFEKIARWQKEDREFRSDRRDPTQQELLLEKRGSLMTTLTVPVLNRHLRNPPVVTADDLTPMRHVEHAFFLRLLSASGRTWLGLGVVIAAISLGCSSIKNRKLSQRTCDILRAKDWLVLLLIGPLIGIMSYVSLVYLTPLGTRDWSLADTGAQQLPLQFAAMLVFVMTLGATISSWRCDRRLAPLTGESKSGKMRWIMTGCAFLALPVLGSISPLVHLAGWKGLILHAILWLGCGLALVPLAWLAFRVAKPLFGMRDPSPRTATLIRMTIPGYLVGFIVLNALAVLFHLEEKHWMSRERLMRITPDAPSVSRQEWDATQVLRAELLEVLDGKAGFQ